MVAGYERLKKLTEDNLEKYLPAVDERSGILRDAMLYSLEAGGKRLRPVLLLAACEMCGGDIKKALPYACAIEYIHTYSLIHDDHPSMDNDDLRRGKPTNHKVFGDDIAILAGDGLLNSAFDIMFRDMISDFSPEKLSAAFEISSAAGVHGMVAGQTSDVMMTGGGAESLRAGEVKRMLDAASAYHERKLSAVEADDGSCDADTADGNDCSNNRTAIGKNYSACDADTAYVKAGSHNCIVIDKDDCCRDTDGSRDGTDADTGIIDSRKEAMLLYIHKNKTGALIRAALRAGAILGGAMGTNLCAVTSFAEKLGLTFQIVDDILDEIGDEEKLGKKTGVDRELGKLTYPSVYGIEYSYKRARQVTEEACRELRTEFDMDGKDSEFLCKLALDLLDRIS